MTTLVDYIKSRAPDQNEKLSIALDIFNAFVNKKVSRIFQHYTTLFNITLNVENKINPIATYYDTSTDRYELAAILFFLDSSTTIPLTDELPGPPGKIKAFDWCQRVFDFIKTTPISSEPSDNPLLTAAQLLLLGIDLNQVLTTFKAYLPAEVCPPPSTPPRTAAIIDWCALADSPSSKSLSY